MRVFKALPETLLLTRISKSRFRAVDFKYFARQATPVFKEVHRPPAARQCRSWGQLASMRCGRRRITNNSVAVRDSKHREANERARLQSSFVRADHSSSHLLWITRLSLCERGPCSICRSHAATRVARASRLTVEEDPVGSSQI